MKKYVWLNKDMTLSASWGEEDHKRAFSHTLDGPALIQEAAKMGHRLISFEIEAGEDFDFTYGSYIKINTPKP